MSFPRYVEPIFEEDEEIPPESGGQYIPAVLTKALRERSFRVREQDVVENEINTNEGYGTFVDDLVPTG